ncbi:CinA-like protein [Verticillium dahliae VDG1]|nr:CinA-like protein [Verticillium dahliae VDG1]
MDAATRPHQLGHAHTGTGTATHDANGSYGRSQIGHAGSGHDGRLLSDNLHRYASSTAAPDAPAAAPPTRDAPSRNPAVAAHLAQPPQPQGVVDALHTLAHLSDAAAAAAARRPHAPPHQLTPDDTSQDTTLTIESDNVFTPPTSQPSRPSQSDMPKSHMNGHASSQESQLLQLSQIAAAQDKMYNPEATSLSRKRTADGAVKDTNVSPVRGGHSRNTSAVSMASTTASTIGDLSSDLKTRLSGPHSATTSSSNPSPATYDTFWRDGTQPLSRRGHNSASPPGVAQPVLSLAPPASIQPSRSTAAHNPRRNSNPHYTPTLLSHSHSASPHTPAQQSSLQGTPLQRVGRTPLADPILFSPHQNVREQDAIETLLFMSSPGNSTSMKHGYAPATSSSQPLPGTRHALPTSQPRKSLPSHRPQPPPKRVGFEKSTSMMEMDVDADSQTGTPRTAVRRRVSGGFGHRSQLSLPAGLGSGHSRPRPKLADEDIERMLDRVAQADDDSSDDEEILLPNRREGEIVG